MKAGELTRTPPLARRCRAPASPTDALDPGRVAWATALLPVALVIPSAVALARDDRRTLGASG